MAKPDYRIIKDRPLPNSYAQYTYSTSYLEETGLSTVDPSDDVYSIMDEEEYNFSFNFSSVFKNPK